MPAVIRGSCFWKPQCESLAREELPFDLKHETSVNPLYHLTNRASSSFWFVTALDSWVPTKTPLSPSERHILRECVNVDMCTYGHGHVGTLQAALH